MDGRLPRLRSAAACGLLALVASCGGGGGGGTPGAPAPPSSLSYAPSAMSFRAGASGPAVAPTTTGGTPTSWSVAPALPSGLLLDPATGVVSGTPAGPTPTATFTVTASNSLGQVQADVTVQVTPALPAAFTSLQAGFQASLFLGSLSNPVKMRFAPDGRLFINELRTAVDAVTGQSTTHVRTVDALGNLVATPWATLTVLGNGEQGLLGLALAPDFSTSGNVYVYASSPAAAPHADRNRILRFTEAGGIGTNMTVVVDDLPIGTTHNAGGLEFGADGMLYATVGDTTNPLLSQTPGALAGHVLRYTPAGGIPADNPTAGSPEWCSGLRNTFDMAVHAGTGGLFAAENGPTSNDEIEFLQKGKDYEWPGPAPGGGPTVGYRVTHWTPVIAPTGITFYEASAFGPAYANNLFVCGYVNGDIRRLVLSGAAFTDLDAEVAFAQFDGSGFQNKPLDIVVAPDGALLVSTFDSIWRIAKYP